MPEEGPSTIFVNSPDMQFPKQPIDIGSSTEAAGELSRALLNHSTFTWENGFKATSSSFRVLVAEVFITAGIVALDMAGITLGDKYLLRIHNPEAPENTQDTWHVVPLHFERRDDYGVLHGVFVDNREDGSGINAYFGQLIIRNHVITGVA